MALEISFRITREELLRFAELTGDRNSLHLDEEFARRSRYRKPVVHGMLLFSYLAFLQFPAKRIHFRKLAAQFLRPAFVGDTILFSADWHELIATQHGFTAKWLRKSDGQELGNAKGEFTLETDSSPVVIEAETGSFVSEELKENNFSMAELSGRTESFTFSLSERLAHAYGKLLAQAVTASEHSKIPRPSASLLASLLLSTLVGMKLPGRAATFLGFEIELGQNIEWDRPYLLSGTVEKISASQSRLSVAAKISSGDKILAEGKCTSLVNPAPRTMISCAEIKARHLDPGLKGKVILVTGASRGIGEVTAKLFAMLGAKVAVNFHRGKSDALDIVNEIKAEGGQALAVQCDVSEAEQVTRMVNSVLEYFGDIDVLVNNAVKDVEQKSVLDLEWKDFQGELDVSLKGLHHCCKAVIPIFQKKQRGKIINLSTTATDSPVSGQAKYIAVKSAVVGYTRALARELAKDNIQANLVSPSLTETDLLAATLPSVVFEKLTAERLCGRNVQPIEVAQSIVFLASNWANAINGEKLVLNLGEDPFV
jgi:3-oxoacyl-[acyl-carrier protein] reductase